jgi:hypothetical protein
MASADFLDTWNTIAADWDRARSEPAPRLRAAPNGVVWLRTWPPEAPELLDLHDRDAHRRGAGWFDSTLDLRDGLSVIEVHAESAELAAVLAAMNLPPR